MGISFSSAPSYFWLNAWVLANVIEIATQRFCNSYVDYRIDPCRRLFDQMVLAARSIRANIAEGSGRHETSYETEMRLTDVARGSVHELLGDFMNYMMRYGIEAWRHDDPRFREVMDMRLEAPNYGADFVHDAMAHVRKQLSRYDSWLMTGEAADAANCLVTLSLKVNAMLTSMLVSQLRDFKKQGGFAENLTRTRLEGRARQSAEEGAPSCPLCGKPMLSRHITRGVRQGQTFWSCSDFPRCRGARNV